MLYRLHNPIKNYAWGSKTSLTEMFGFTNNHHMHMPQAEVWMGAHPGGSSTITVNGNAILLNEWIARAPEKILGERVYRNFGRLPYLLKLLAVEKPLSIQVHPEKTKALAGFLRENDQGIPLNAPHRNYKDANHKPELVYTLTPFLAMNAFRPLDEVVSLFEQSGCTDLLEPLVSLARCPDAKHLRHFFRLVMTLNGENKHRVLAQLLENVTEKGHDENTCRAFRTVSSLAMDYPNDIGLFSPLFLNVIELASGEAMFLNAETPHTYLKGTGIEVMANSDNVLRAGLTSKYVDIEELLANTRCESIPARELRTPPLCNKDICHFPVPVADFRFSIITVNTGQHNQKIDSVEMLLCIEGKMTVTSGGQELTLQPGDCGLVAASSKQYALTGKGKTVRISV